MYRKTHLTIAVAGTLLALAAHADVTFRCGSELVKPGMTQKEVLSQCGEPDTRTVEDQDVRSGNQVTGKTQVSHWTYSSYGATRVLVFDQDRLVGIE
ncbi:MAG: DUF2845 domain-containing protein [Lysobacterales bacterium]|nr:MAG: DUF2845 domain-containing protein [Xanthomonadales bacterium]